MQPEQNNQKARKASANIVKFNDHVLGPGDHKVETAGKLSGFKDEPRTRIIKCSNRIRAIGVDNHNVHSFVEGKDLRIGFTEQCGDLRRTSTARPIRKRARAGSMSSMRHCDCAKWEFMCLYPQFNTPWTYCFIVYKKARVLLYVLI
ncbi:hypothetical protein Ddc_21110 [Ditylenchus destructor]|nr:hypothetical protein Ddc_21110 [Ditylenchus destructor]